MFDGAPLVMEQKTAFLERKDAERSARGGGEKRRHRGDDVDDDGSRGGRGGRDEDVGHASVTAEVTKEDVDEYIGEGGMLVSFTFDLPEEEKEKLKGVTFGLVKDSLGGKDAGLEYVEYKAGESDGCARFHSGASAKAAISGESDGKMMIAGFSARVQIMGGDEERSYVEKMLQAKKQAAAERAARERDGKRGGRGGRGRGRGGRNSGYHKRQRKM